MYIKKENGKNKQFHQLPKYYKHWAGSFHEQKDEIHKKEGFMM